MKKLTTASLIAAAAVALLAGCSTTGPDKKTETAKPESKPSASATVAASNTCKDGILTVTDSKAAKDALKQGCDTVYLLTSNVDLELGAVKTLGIEGSDNTVSVDSVASVYVLGTGNTITHGGAAPKADNVQDGNTITAE